MNAEYKKNTKITSITKQNKNKVIDPIAKSDGEFG